MAKTIVGLYDDLSQARAVVQDLADSGFDRGDISFVANAAAEEYGSYFDEEGRYQGDRDDMTAGEGAAAGAGIGATIGGLGGLLMGLGLLAIPGVGPALAAGPIVSALVGMGIGAAAGGIGGALANSGVPEEEAGYYAEGVRRGGSLVTLSVDEDRVDEAERIMNRHNPVDIEERTEGWRSEGFDRYDPQAEPYTAEQIASERGRWDSGAALAGSMGAMRDTDAGMTRDVSTRDVSTMRDTDDAFESERREVRGDRDQVIPVIEEEVAIGKREVEGGGVRVRSYVREEPVEAEVTLRDEEVRVERRPVDRDVTDADDAFRERSFEMTETSEEAVVEKRARVVEEVMVSKDVQDHTETVRDSVRRTEVEVENMDAQNQGRRSQGRGDVPAIYDDVEMPLDADMADDYRRHYDTTFGAMGRDYQDYDPAYRYGSSLSSNASYQGRNWNTVETDARQGWERDNPGSAWDEFRDAIRYSFERNRNRA